MSVAIWFWIIFVVALLFWGFRSYREPYFVNSLVFWVLIFLLGLGTFGSPLK